MTSISLSGSDGAPEREIDEVASAHSSDTFYEYAADTVWGRYLNAPGEAALRAAASSLGGGTSLDVGCDAGRWSQLLADLGFSPVCVDVREEALEICRRRLPSARCHLAQPDDVSFPVADGSIDLLLAWEVPPVTNAAWFAPEAARVVRSGGLLICTIFNPVSIRGLAYRCAMLVSPSRRKDRVYGGPSFARATADLDAQGFDLLSAEGLGWAPFSRLSNAPLIPFFVRLERVLGLRRLVRFSPFVVLVARRRPTEAQRPR